MFDTSTLSAIARVAEKHGIGRSGLTAVAAVESGGIAFTRINGVMVPVIRIEGHYFDRLVPASKRSLARSKGLASPIVGGVKNPSSQEARYRILQEMIDIDRDAAIMSISWGVGQVMGVHWKDLGFTCPDDLRIFVLKSVENQVELMVRFIERNGLLDEIERQDWAGFARGYNGPGYKQNRYDQKLRDAFSAYDGVPLPSPATGMLRLGSSGAGVREIQTLLLRAGFPVKIDGDLGPSTRDSIKAFQQMRGLAADGLAGPQTMAALKAYQVSPSEQPGALGAIQVPQVGNAVKAAGPLAFITAGRDQIADAAAHLTGTGSAAADAVANGLLAATGFIGAGLAAYALYGWWRSTRTVEQ